MKIFSEWKINRALRHEIKDLMFRMNELEKTIQAMNKHYKAGPIHIYLINEIKKKDKEYNILKKEYEKLQEWSKRIFEIGQRDASELVWIKFRYFNLMKDYKITEMNLVGADKSYAFAINRFEQIREENLKLKEKLKKHEEKDEAV